MKTALITGATEGIGFEFSKLLAEKGLNLILIARNQKKLNEMNNELSARGINVIVYAKDLSILENVKFIYEDLKQKNINVDYLINNAGFGISGDFTDVNWEYELQMYNLNMIALSYFTKAFAQDMLKRKFGRILNLGSVGSFQPGPYMAGYCATKAFVLALSQAVNNELKGTNVSVTTLCPGVTDSKFHDVANTKRTMMSHSLSHATSEEVARYGIKILEKKKSFGVHGFMNKLLVFCGRLMPRNRLISMTGNFLKPQK